MSAAAAVAAMISSCPVVNGDPARAPELMARCRQIVRAVPVQRLHFRKDPSFWDVLEVDEGRRTKDGG